MKFFCVFLLQICYQKFWQSTCLWITVIITGIGTGFIYSSLFTRAALQSQSCFTVATSSRACKLSHQSYTSPSTLSCLSVRFVCNVGVLWPNGWTDQDELGMRVGLGPDHAVLDGDPAPPLPRGTRPQFSFHICCHKMAQEYFRKFQPPWWVQRTSVTEQGRIHVFCLGGRAMIWGAYDSK